MYSDDTLNLTGLEEEVISMAMDDEEGDRDTDDSDTVYSSVSGILKINEPVDVLNDNCCPAYRGSLELLATHAPRANCHLCNEGYNIQTTSRGAALYMTWVWL